MTLAESAKFFDAETARYRAIAQQINLQPQCAWRDLFVAPATLIRCRLRRQESVSCLLAQAQDTGEGGCRVTTRAANSTATRWQCQLGAAGRRQPGCDRPCSSPLMKVIVLGAGLLGATSAYVLRQQGQA